MIGWAIETLAASALLMLVVLALRGMVARRFGAPAAYMLWLLPALRMILPRLPEKAVPIPAAEIHTDVARLITTAVLRPHQAPPIAAAAASVSPGSTDWLSIALILWLGGAATYLVWQLGRHHHFMATALGHADRGFLRAGIKVRLSPAVSGPLAAGILHRRILLPEDFEQRYTAAEQRLAIAHELAHHRRGDLVANAFALLVLSLHWFNPIAHWAYRAFRTDQELACDATVLDATPESRADYGSALIKSARAGMPASAVCALGPAKELKRRISMIAHPTGNRGRRIAGTVIATVLIGAGLCLTASGSIAAPSKIAPEPVKPIFRLQSQPQAQPEAQAARPKPQRELIAVAQRNAIGASDRDADGAMLPHAPASPAAPLPPAPPADGHAPLPPLPPLPPTAPMPPAPPRMSAEAREAMPGAVRHAGEEARKAGEQARRDIANIDFAAVTRDAMNQTRAELERSCTHARPGPADESDKAAIKRLSTGCVDMAAINRQVQEGLRQATEEIRRDRDLSDADRAHALAAIDRARTDMARKFGE